MIQEILQQYLPEVEQHLKRLLELQEKNSPVELQILQEALQHSMFPGGKRIRAILMILVYQLFDTKGWKKVLPSACAVEMVHLSSLLLDDLPCMDDADLRRGKETCHRKYGEDVAILAATGLLNLAYQIIGTENTSFSPQKICQIFRELSYSIGFSGMIGGQFVDLRYHPEVMDLEKLEYIHSHKTSSLFIGSLRIAALLAGARANELESITKFGKNLGLAYQIKDDLLDQEVSEEQMGKDRLQDKNKLTFVAFCGFEQSRELLKRLTQSAIQALDIFGKRAHPLIEISYFLAKRDK